MLEMDDSEEDEGKRKSVSSVVKPTSTQSSCKIKSRKGDPVGMEAPGSLEKALDHMLMDDLLRCLHTCRLMSQPPLNCHSI